MISCNTNVKKLIRINRRNRPEPIGNLGDVADPVDWNGCGP